MIQHGRNEHDGLAVTGSEGGKRGVTCERGVLATEVVDDGVEATSLRGGALGRGGEYVKYTFGRDVLCGGDNEKHGPSHTEREARSPMRPHACDTISCAPGLEEAVAGVLVECLAQAPFDYIGLAWWCVCRQSNLVNAARGQIKTHADGDPVKEILGARTRGKISQVEGNK